MIDLSRRSAGILMHITSLPGRWGIGDLGPEAYAFADSVAKTGARYWQMLPLCPTGYGNSPYSGVSTFAGNELLISPDLLVKDGLLDRSDIGEVPSFPETHVDYSAVQKWKLPILRKAAVAALSDSGFRKRLDGFRNENSFWIEDYAVFRTLEQRYNDARWHSIWPKNEGMHDPKAIAQVLREQHDQVGIWQALQLIFNDQCMALKRHCASKGILTIGDIPIFVGMDSADAWARPELFKRDAQGHFSSVSGVPPDVFSATGQLWGTPVYDWQYHQKTGFKWWTERIRRCLKLNDVLRIDHFRGFDAYYDIPAGSETAEHGTWTHVPGKEFFNVLRRNLGELAIIAEDLGNVNQDVIDLRKSNGFPGMKIAQFGFHFLEDGSFDDPERFLPEHYEQSFVAYTGTHDNDTTRGWFNSLDDVQRKSVLSYLGTDEENVVSALVKLIMDSCACMTVIQMQDILGLDGWARMNYPSTCNDTNWSWRMKASEFTEERIGWFRNLIVTASRL